MLSFFLQHDERFNNLFYIYVTQSLMGEGTLYMFDF